jgi:glucans biosynthesis protein C
VTTSNRLYFFDNLRAFVIILVVVLHGSMTYMAYAPTWWYVVDPSNSEIFTQLVLLIDVPIMPILFFLAGYFALPSLQKRGVRLFLKEKFVRIGIPWIFGALFLAPLITYMIYFSRHIPMSYLQFWATDFWGKMYQQSVYWFLGILMFLFIGLGFAFSQSDRLRASTRRVSTSARKPLAVFATIMALAFLAINLFFHIDNWSHIYLLVFQPVRIPLYIGYFILGLYAERHSWFMTDGFNPELGPWAATCFLTGLGYLACRWTSAAPNALLIIATAILFNVFCLSSLVAGILFFRQKVNSADAVWQSLAANSYGIYYVHPLILYPLAYVFVGISLPLIVKAPALIVLAIMLSWAVSALLLKRLPVVRAMF